VSVPAYEPSQPQPVEPERAPQAATVRTLAQALADMSNVPIPRTELEAGLRAMVDRMVEALLADRFATQAGTEAGAGLVALQLTRPDAAGRAVEIIGGRLLEDLRVDSPDLRRRLAALLGALAGGYAGALRDRTCTEQESLQQAALTARRVAEHALRASELRRWHEAHHDTLTGLPNRMLFAARLAELADRAPAGARVGVCVLDVDALKAVTDSLGHGAGDQLLVAVADRLRQTLVRAGNLVTRLDGDEFGILIRNTTSAEEVVAVAEAALAAVSAPMTVGGQQLSVSASAGVVERRLAGADPGELMRAAHLTLSWAKADGGNRCAVFDPARNARATERYVLASDMPGALRRGEFTVAYQPIVSLTDGRVGGLEALVRWRHPQLGLLAPDRFIDLAEESSLIISLGQAVLRIACEQAASWADLRTAPPLVSVNLAVAQTRHERLPDDVTRVLGETGLQPRRLQLEITESAMMGSDEKPLARLRQLADAGVQIAIDDFGTGWANLAYLRDMPVCNLKLDASFVRGLRPTVPPNPADEQIIAGLTSLGHALGLTVTAEGVETMRQAERLRDLGCDTGQGWFFARPTSSEKLADLLVADEPVWG
jgi:diguanylate cyclase (GGDEF)-like protein